MGINKAFSIHAALVAHRAFKKNTKVRRAQSRKVRKEIYDKSAMHGLPRIRGFSNDVLHINAISGSRL
jgi:hypothetical protein